MTLRFHNVLSLIISTYWCCRGVEMIKTIGFVILSLALATLVGAEYCDKSTEYITFGGKLRDGQSMGDLCECMRAHMIETGALNKTAEFSCKRDPNFTKLRWKQSDRKDELNVKDQLGCSKCMDNCFITDGDNAEVCEVINSSRNGLVDVLKRVARKVIYYECGLTITRETFSIGDYIFERVTISYYELPVRSPATP
ncbi:hypothetical protein Bhyg_05690 [Pseudolycoriella hygida]|uniref:Uncharacterized protein n=1 Tax=Pseudolycoriella hygida TaxID=35572 RepID=A0A9Q0MZ67_9DIPT|nr:hypothetical protein Bhyg_05690 [Pseudolycoriella hygida]